eukprot:454717_1
MAPPCEGFSKQGVECFVSSPVLNKTPSSDAADSETKKLVESSTNYDENLWTIHGVKYDLSSFADKHPGGKNAILLGKGRDCSALFESYHPFTDAPRQILNLYTCEKAGGSGGIAEVAVPRRKIPSQKDVDPFYHEMCNRVRGVFESNGIDTSRIGNFTATKFRIVHYIICGIAFFVCYTLYINAYRVGPAVFAFSCWIQGSLGHDASHFSISRINWVNRLGTYLGMGLLSSPFLWMYQHTYAHHSYTNIYEKDPDLHHFFFLRVCSQKSWARKYVLQASVIYVCLWWSMITFGEAVWLPFRAIMSGRLDSALEGVEGRVWALRPIVSLTTHVFLYLSIVAIIPLCWGNEAFTWESIIFYWLFSGITFGVFTQVSHLCKGSFEHMEPLGDKKKESKPSTWAENQVISSNNYGLNTWLWFQLSIGLNYQIEHHLFPGCNAEYLPLIAPTVREVCEEYGVRYKTFDNISCIFNAVMENLIILSRDNDGIVKAAKS